MNGPHRSLLLDVVPPRSRLIGGFALWLCLSAAAFAQTDPNGSITSPPAPTESEFRRSIQLPVQASLRAPQPDRQAKELIDKLIHYYVWLQADPAQALQRQENRKKMMDLLRSKSTSDIARAYAYDQVILRCRQLFNEADAGVRVAACHLLNELNVSFNPDIPYVPVADALLATLAFPDDKYVQVKVVAVPGITRILRDAPVSALGTPRRLEIGGALAAEINRLRQARGQPGAAPAVGYQWLMWQLVTAVGYVDRAYNSERQPVFADALLSVLSDPGEDWLSRVRAAQALSRLQFEGTANLSVINYELARMLHDFAQQYNTLLAGGQVLPMSRRVALHAYFAYYAQSPAEKTLNLGLLNQVNRPGLAGHKGAIEGARSAALPIINSLFGNTGKPLPIPAADIANLAKWLQDNPLPADPKLVPESKLKLPAPLAGAAPPANGAN